MTVISAGVYRILLIARGITAEAGAEYLYIGFYHRGSRTYFSLKAGYKQVGLLKVLRGLFC